MRFLISFGMTFLDVLSNFGGSCRNPTPTLFDLLYKKGVGDGIPDVPIRLAQIYKHFVGRGFAPAEKDSATNPPFRHLTMTPSLEGTAR